MNQSHKATIRTPEDLIPLLKSIPAGQELELEIILDISETALKNEVDEKYQEFYEQAHTELRLLEQGRILRIHISHPNGSSLANSLIVKFPGK